jgi:Rne/Rng family ribonuclease
MTKELFVSSTPHETRVGLVEDDQLAEIYLERENEYTLAGSIYKGRVTRVLPGMQSAFVDIGLERDAFLYVSDFMELEESDELDDVPVPRVASAQINPSQPAMPSQSDAAVAGPPVGNGEAEASMPRPSEAAVPGENRESTPAEGREGRGWRGRRRRGRGGRHGERTPESRSDRPTREASREPSRPPREEYGPPAGYQPILLPGESISKYQRMAQAHPQPPVSHSDEPVEQSGPASTPVAGVFPEDEPLFTEDVAHEIEGRAEDSPAPAEYQNAGVWERPQDEPEPIAAAAEQFPKVEQEDGEPDDGGKDQRSSPPEVGSQFASGAAAGTLEEEEIEDEEADLASYVEELEEDAALDEMEEETHAADSYQPSVSHEIAASGDTPAAASAGEPAVETTESSEAAPESGESEEEDAEEDEAALEEAQAEAEALLAAEAGGNGAAEARAEVRAPAATAGYTQRAQRPGYDRRGGFRGRRGGGRRFRRRENQQVPQISDLLKEGQEILVQIAKEPIGKKGARITSHIALPGRFLVYMPTVNHTGVSRKIASEEERQRLKRIIMSERENGHGGFIVRTAAQGASEDELRADIRFLKGLWAEIKGRGESGPSPALIYHDLNVVERVLRDQVTSDFTSIWVDTDEEYERILRFANRFQPALVKRVKLYTKETPLFDQFGLTDEINKALKSKVWLKSGGYIVINQTEALVAIDVNTGKYVGKTARLEDTIVKTNVDAIKEIVRQVRLRDLGGIIVIDFIDMDERRNRQKVMQALEEALRSDRAPSKALQFNDFGLVAITRKRVKQSLERTIGTPCPYCQATGFVKSVQTICNEIYVEMRKIAKHLEHADVMLRVNPDVAKALKTNNGRALNELEELTKKTVIVKSDPALHQEQFDIN